MQAKNSARESMPNGNQGVSVLIGFAVLFSLLVTAGLIYASSSTATVSVQVNNAHKTLNNILSQQDALSAQVKAAQKNFTSNITAASSIASARSDLSSILTDFHKFATNNYDQQTALRSSVFKSQNAYTTSTTSAYKSDNSAQKAALRTQVLKNESSFLLELAIGQKDIASNLSTYSAISVSNMSSLATSFSATENNFTYLVANGDAAILSAMNSGDLNLTTELESLLPGNATALAELQQKQSALNTTITLDQLSLSTLITDRQSTLSSVIATDTATLFNRITHRNAQTSLRQARASAQLCQKAQTLETNVGIAANSLTSCSEVGANLTGVAFGALLYPECSNPSPSPQFGVYFFNPGTNVVLNANPESGCYVSEWSETNSSLDSNVGGGNNATTLCGPLRQCPNTQSLVVNQNYTIIAQMSPLTRTLDFVTVNNCGSLITSPIKVLDPEVTYNTLQNLTLNATLGPNCHVSGWSIAYSQASTLSCNGTVCTYGYGAVTPAILCQANPGFRGEPPTICSDNATLPVNVTSSYNIVNVTVYLTPNATTTTTTIPQVSVTGTIPVGEDPAAVAFNPSGTFAYVVNQLNSTISVISAVTNTVVGTIGVGQAPFDVAFNPSGTLAYVTGDSESLQVINTTTGTVVNSIALNMTAPDAVAFSPSGTFAYVTNTTALFDGAPGVGTYSNTITIVNVAQNESVGQITVGSAPKAIAFNPSGTLAYVVNSYGSYPNTTVAGENGDSVGTVSVISTATNTVVYTIDVGSDPVSVAFSPSGAFAYVANSGSDTVSVINVSENETVENIAVGSVPVSVAFTPSGALALVVDQDADSVSVINASENATSSTVSVGSYPDAVAISPSGTFGYVANSCGNQSCTNTTGSVSIVSIAVPVVVPPPTTTVPPSFPAIVGSINVGNSPLGVAFNPSGTLAYVTNFYTDTLSVINTATDTVIGSINVGSGPIAVVLNPSGTLAYVTDQSSGAVSVVNIAENETVDSISVGGYPKGVAFSPNGAYAYVVNGNSYTYTSIINTTTGTVTNTINVGNVGYTDPTGVALSPSGTLAYIVNADNDTVSVVNTTNYAVIATINVGDDPCAVVLNPSGTLAYVANTGSGTVSVINTTTDNIVATINVGVNPFDIAFNPSGSIALVTNLYGPTGGPVGTYGVVSVINTTTETVVKTLAVGLVPVGVAISPNGTFAYVADQDSNNVTVIELGQQGSPVPPNEVVNVSGVNSTGTLCSNTARSFTINYESLGSTFAAVPSSSTCFTLVASNATPAFSTNSSVYPLGFGPINVVNVSVNSTESVQSLNVTMQYPCSINATLALVTPFMLVNGTMQEITPYSTNMSRCTVSFTAPSDPIVGLYDIVGRAYVANYGSDNVSVIDIGSDTVINTLLVDQGPYDLAIAPGNSLVYVTNSCGNDPTCSRSSLGTMNTIVVATNVVSTKTYSLGVYPYGIAFNPTGTASSATAYVANGDSGTLNVITVNLGVISDSSPPINIGPNSYPVGLAVSPNGKLIYVADESDQNVSVVSTTTKTVVNTIGVGVYPGDVIFNSAGTVAYVTNTGSDTVSVINTATNTVTATISVGQGPFDLALNPSGTLLYVPDVGPNGGDGDNLTVISTATDTVVNTITVGWGPWGVAFDPSGQLAYVVDSCGTDPTCSSPGAVSVVDVATNSTLYTINSPYFEDPTGIALEGSYTAT